MASLAMLRWRGVPPGTGGLQGRAPPRLPGWPGLPILPPLCFPPGGVWFARGLWNFGKTWQGRELWLFERLLHVEQNAGFGGNAHLDRPLTCRIG